MDAPAPQLDEYDGHIRALSLVLAVYDRLGYPTGREIARISLAYRDNPPAAVGAMAALSARVAARHVRDHTCRFAPEDGQAAVARAAEVVSGSYDAAVKDPHERIYSLLSDTRIVANSAERLSALYNDRIADILAPDPGEDADPDLLLATVSLMTCAAQCLLELRMAVALSPDEPTDDATEAVVLSHAFRAAAQAQQYIVGYGYPRGHAHIPCDDDHDHSCSDPRDGQ